jgi:hypothetical protein
MDPLSVSTTVASLIGISFKLAKSLNDLRAKFQRTQRTVSSLCGECSITTAGLSLLQELMLTRSDIFGSSIQSRQDLLQCFSATMFNMAQTFSVLDIELEKLTGVGDPPDRLGITARMRFMWIEDDLKGLIQEIRDQRDALGFLMDCVQL